MVSKLAYTCMLHIHVGPLKASQRDEKTVCRTRIAECLAEIIVCYLPRAAPIVSRAHPQSSEPQPRFQSGFIVENWLIFGLKCGYNINVSQNTNMFLNADGLFSCRLKEMIAL